MTASALIRRAEAEGVHLFLTSDGRVRLSAPNPEVGRVWLERLRGCKTQVISALSRDEPQMDRRRIWRITVDTKSFTMIDPAGEPEEAVRKRLIGKFGADRFERLEEYRR